jgi:pyridoxine 5-phosphate synthase
MAATDEMLSIALRHQPHACCLVPERREERTTEGGLDVAGQREGLVGVVDALKTAGSRVSLFIEADPLQLDAAADVGSDIVELHTGRYCDLVLAGDAAADDELMRLRDGAAHAAALGLEVHAGHGLTFNTVKAIAAIPELVELNIGHFLIGEGIFIGLDRAVGQMRASIAEERGAISTHSMPANISGVT